MGVKMGGKCVETAVVSHPMLLLKLRCFGFEQNIAKFVGVLVLLAIRNLFIQPISRSFSP